MLLLSELDVAKRIGHPFFDGNELTETAKKKRIRQLARRANLPPVVKKQDVWLFHKEDIERLLECRSNLQKDKIHRTGKSRVPTAESAFEKARRLTTKP